MKAVFSLLLFIVIFASPILEAENWYQEGKLNILKLETMNGWLQYTITGDGKYFVTINKISDSEFKIQKFDMKNGEKLFSRIKKVPLCYLSADGETYVNCLLESQVIYKAYNLETDDSLYTEKSFQLMTMGGESIFFTSRYAQYVPILNRILKDYEYSYTVYYGSDTGSETNENSNSLSCYNVKTKNSASLFNHSFSSPNYTKNRNNSSIKINEKTVFPYEEIYGSLTKIVLTNDDKCNIFYSNKYRNTILQKDVKSNINLKKHTFKNDNNSKYAYEITKDGKFIIEKFANRIRIYDTENQFPFYDEQISDSLPSADFKLSDDETCFYTFKNDCLIKFPFPTKTNELKVMFTAKDSLLFKDSTYSFVNYSTGSPDSLIWDFGDGTISKDFSPNHKFNKLGYFVIKLRIFKDSTTAIDSLRLKVVKRHNIGIAITDSSKYIPIKYRFYNMGGNDTTEFKWVFGDGSSIKSSSRSVEHEYSKDGIYTIKLYAFYQHIVDSTTKIITINTLKEDRLDEDTYSEKIFPVYKSMNNCSQIFESNDGSLLLIGFEENKTVIKKTDNNNKLDTFSFGNYFPKDYYTYNLAKYVNMKILERLDDKYLLLRYDHKTFAVLDNELSIIKKIPVKEIASSLSDDATLTGLINYFSVDSSTKKVTFIFSTTNESIIITFNYNFKIISNSEITSPFAYQYRQNQHEPKMYDYRFAYNGFKKNVYYYSSTTECYYIVGSHTEHITNINRSCSLPSISDIFVAFGNNDDGSIIGLTIDGKVIKYTENLLWDNQISVNGSFNNLKKFNNLFYAIGEVAKHPICYIIDENLIVLDTVFIESRLAVFKDVINTQNGDLVFSGQKFSTSSKDKVDFSMPFILRLLISNSVKDVSSNIEVKLYNQTNQSIDYEIRNTFPSRCDLKITNLLGIEILKSQINIESLSANGVIPINNLSTGIYFISFNINNFVITKKFIVF